MTSIIRPMLDVPDVIIIANIGHDNNLDLWPDTISTNR